MATPVFATPATVFGRTTVTLSIVRLLPAMPGTVAAQGPPVQLRFGPGDAVTVASFSFLPRSGVARTSNSSWCGVTIRAGTKPVQAVVTVGTGATWYASCGRLGAIGTLPAPAGRARFAVINDVLSPSATEPGSAFLVRNGDRWKLDEQLAIDPKLENVPVTIPALRRALRACAVLKVSAGKAAGSRRGAGRG